jgi:hypothetical protein
VAAKRRNDRRVRSQAQRVGVAALLVEEEVADNREASGSADVVAVPASIMTISGAMLTLRLPGC